MLPPVVAPPPGKLLPALVLALRKYASGWRCMMVRQPLCDVAGLIQAARVIAEPRFSEADEGTWTMAPLRSKESPPPYFPAVHVAAVMVPLLPLPEMSVAVVPEPASNVYPATRPGGPVGAAGVTAVATLEYPLTLPD